MKKIVLTLIVLLHGMLVHASTTFNNIQIVKSDNSTLSYPIAWVDSVVSNNNNQTLFLSIPSSEIKEIIFPNIIAENQINLNSNDKNSFFNELFSITLKESKNAQLDRDYTISLRENSAVMVLPHITDFTAFVPEFNCFGSYIFVNGKQIKNGEESIDFSQPAEIKIVAYNGDVHTYSLTLKNSSLPLVTLESQSNVNEEITTEWKDNFMFAALDSYGKTNCNGLCEFRGRGKNYSPNRKNTYGIKLAEKTKVLDMPKGKRWIILPCGKDESLLRASLGFSIYKEYLGSCWTPNYKACELIVNSTYKGSYLIAEQIRITDERIINGQILSIESEADADDESFISEISKSLFVFQDPEVGLIGTKMIRSKVLIDEFESFLYSDNNSDRNKAVEMINKQSFIDWIIINELAKNESAFTEDCYMTISPENIISMGPIWDMSECFGLNSNDTFEDFTVINQGWAKQLFLDKDFAESVYQRFQVIYSKKETILKWIDEEAKNKLSSAFGNELLHNNLGGESDDYLTFTEKYMREIEELKTWMDARIEWLNKSLK